MHEPPRLLFVPQPHPQLTKNARPLHSCTQLNSGELEQRSFGEMHVKRR